ncbi:MAG: hypothetical protein CRU78_04760 [Candidatus Accumulibacter phosphatis]|uniref:Uncharacterized protein n=1 Tax=Candidatus Accumulibacter phosphatis TaxID=327160 RepID=A0A6A7RR57_9PROT|nr:hypothetical protein [Candidatus Accumulibacter phosphatis]
MKKAVQKAAAPGASSTKAAKVTTKATAELPLRILKIARCSTVSGKSTLTYHVGCTPESVIKIRLYGNTGNGFLNQDWISWTAIQGKLELHSPFTSQVLHALFSGKSLNSPGFLMAVLKAEGVVKASTVKGRCYELTKDAGFLAEIERLTASSIELDADTEGREEAKTAAKAKPKKQAGEAEATTEAPSDVDTST